MATRSLPLPTVILTERVSATVGLSADCADHLIANWRRVVSVVPVGREDFRLTPRGYVGVLPTPEVRFVIRSKIPLQNVLFMLDAIAPVVSATDHADAEAGDVLVDFLARQFVRRVGERLAAGLHRDYVDRRDVGPFLRGQIDVAAQMRETRPARLHCAFEEFTHDIPCNQAPVATAERLLHSPLANRGTRLAVQEVLSHLGGIRAVPAAPDLSAPPEYVDLLAVCRLIDDALCLEQASGSQAGPAFLLNLERVFERYVAGGLVAAGLSLRVQPTVRLAGGRGLSLRPDLIVETPGQEPIVADTKWKRKIAAPDDVYQVVTYATALAIRRGLLLYPSNRNGAHELVVGPVRLGVRRLNVAGTPDECRRALARLAQDLNVNP